MRSDPRIAVADTNVVISAFLFPHSRAAIALRVLLGERTVLSSTSTLEELHSVLRRRKFESRMSLSLRLQALAEYEAITSLVSVAEHIRACRDPSDDKFLELAVSGGAGLILTGDADLLALHPFHGIAILTPADYLAGLPSEAPTVPGT